jgi:hypothetical protein
MAKWLGKFQESREVPGSLRSYRRSAKFQEVWKALKGPIDLGCSQSQQGL